MSVLRRLFLAVAFGVAAPSAPALADDLSALDIADQASQEATPASPWRGYWEASIATSCGRDGRCNGVNERLSVNLGYDKLIAPELRFVFENRLDVNARAQLTFPKRTHTLKEAYFGWQPNDRWMLDAGRINQRHGMGQGYNPTDFFRAHALRTVVSVDPASTKANRLGTVGLRGQTVWDSGSVTALFSPKLASHPSDATFNADLGSTNNRNRWLVALSQHVGSGFSPQWLYYQEEGAAPQFGLNMSWAPHEAVVAFMEWKGGRGQSQLDDFRGLPGKRAFHSQSTTGLTFTTRQNLTVTIEYEHNGAAPDGSQWQALSRANPLAARQYLLWAKDLQELPTQRAVFALARWQNAMFRNLDLSALTRLNLDDHSRMAWLEALYHIGAADVALQWQTNRGNESSEFGITPPGQAWQLLMRYHF
jgi:hypothetical protein